MPWCRDGGNSDSSGKSSGLASGIRWALEARKKNLGLALRCLPVFVQTLLATSLACPPAKVAGLSPSAGSLFGDLLRRLAVGPASCTIASLSIAEVMNVVAGVVVEVAGWEFAVSATPPVASTSPPTAWAPSNSSAPSTVEASGTSSVASSSWERVAAIAWCSSVADTELLTRAFSISTISFTVRLATDIAG